MTAELDVTEGERAERGGEGERDRLGEIGADELAGPDPGIEEQQRDDHQRP